jgi:hypothetical protein
MLPILYLSLKYISFHEPVLNFSPTSRVRASASLSLQIEHITRYHIRVASNGIAFIPDFMAVGQEVQKLKGGHPDTHTGSVTEKPTFIP